MMPNKFYNDNPTVSDTVLFDLLTTDVDGAPVDPYKVNQATVYFIERGFTADNVRSYTTQFGDTVLTQYYKDAAPVGLFGNEDVPAWVGSDTDHAFITKRDFDDEGNPLVGAFRLEWAPQLAREGDYFLCYSWTPIVAGNVLTQTIQFYLFGDTRKTTSMPSHFTTPNKYETLLERYLPEMFKMFLSVRGGDLTPDVLDRANLAVAKGFTTVEDLANQMVDLVDANVVSDAMLPYLGNLFGLQLKGNDVTLCRKQIKRAVPLYKKKGTLGGLREALANSDIQFNRLAKLWQVTSKSTWQDGFVITADQEGQSTPVQFILSKVATLPIDALNFELAIRLAGSGSYTELTSDYVTLSNSGTGAVCDGVALGETVMTWVGDQLSVSPLTLAEGDVVRVTYAFAAVSDQSIEDYVRSLPLSDQRDERDVTYPVKNWNVRVIAEDDPMFDVVIPSKHPFQYPVMYGRIRTEFPFSENIYNMDEYDGMTRDSHDPCDLDKSFVDVCGDCQGSKYIIDVEVEDLSAERLQDTEEVINGFMPFHAVVHSVNYVGSKNEFIPSPVEEVEILITWDYTDNVISTQMDFNRLIEDGASDAQELKRNMLASFAGVAATGTGVNIAIVLFSPGVRFDTLGIDADGNYLEILSGADQGEYVLSPSQRYTADIVQGQPDTINWPLDTSGFPYRLSNKLYRDTSASVYRDNVFKFSDPNPSITFIDFGAMDDWKVQITSGPYAGTYVVTSLDGDNAFAITGFPTNTSQTGLSYALKDAGDVVKHVGTAGVVTSSDRGRVEMDLVALELGFSAGDYVKFGGSQYLVTRVEPRGVGATVDKVYIDGYVGGDVVGIADVTVCRRLVDNAVGYLSVRGMRLTGTVPPVDYTAETDQFLENYLIQTGVNYYRIVGINGSDMILDGAMQEWGLSGTSVSYTILRFTKTSPITSQAGDYQGDAHVFDRLDRRGQDSYVIETETQAPMFMQAAMLNSINSGQPVEAVGQQESIWFSVEHRN